MKCKRRVLVATDLSEGSDEALREGARVASSDRFAVVHVVRPIAQGGAFLHSPRATEAERVREELGRIERVVRDHVMGVIGPHDVEVFIEQGVDHSEIVRRAAGWEADVLIVGSRTPSVLGHLFRGVVERLIREAHCPVLIARRSDGQDGVIAATDLSKPNLPAVVAGAEEAERRGTHLKVVHAVGFISAETRYLLTPTARQANHSDLSSFTEELEHAVAALGFDQTCQVLAGSAARAVVRDASATNAELIVVVRRADSDGRLHAMSRGVAEDIASSAPCSVLVVRAPRSTTVQPTA